MSLISLFLSIVFAQSGCPDTSYLMGQHKIRAMDTRGPSGCYISSIASSTLAARRSFNFFKEGQFTVFTEIGEGGGRMSTGFRSYHILPAGQPQKIEPLLDSVVRVKHSSGLDWLFDKSGSVAIDQKCKLAVNKNVSWGGESTDGGKSGGFFLEKCPNTIIIDSGFSRGRNNNQIRTAISQVRDSSGKSCSVKNEQIFNYLVENPKEKDPKKHYYQAVIKSSKDLYTILSRECASKDMDFSPLNSVSSSKKGNSR